MHAQLEKISPGMSTGKLHHERCQERRRCLVCVPCEPNREGLFVLLAAALLWTSSENVPTHVVVRSPTHLPERKSRSSWRNSDGLDALIITSGGCSGGRGG